MDSRSTVPGARRRAAVRAVLGKPGSLRRWLLWTLLFVFFCGLMWIESDFLVRIVIFILGAVVVIVGFRARSLLTGEEDEMHAWVGRTVSKQVRSPEPDDQQMSEADEWAESVRRRVSGTHDAPLPPSAEDEGPGLTPPYPY